MFAAVLELLGFTAITVAAYEWSGRPLAFFVAGILLWFVAQGLSGVKPAASFKARAQRVIAARKAERQRRAASS
jgi:hypothetical protein